MTGKTPLPYKPPVVGHPVAAHRDDLLQCVGSKPPDIVQMRAKPHGKTIVILQIDRFFRGAVVFKIGGRGTDQPPVPAKTSDAQ